eukprot:1086718-Pleurochrysis_carterae.AAC.1
MLAPFALVCTSARVHRAAEDDAEAGRFGRLGPKNMRKAMDLEYQFSVRARAVACLQSYVPCTFKHVPSPIYARRSSLVHGCPPVHTQ